jgi:hypothetical protein
MRPESKKHNRIVWDIVQSKLATLLREAESLLN